MKRDPVILIVVAMVASLMLVFGIQMARKSPAPVPDRLQGQLAPDFTLRTLDGKTVKLSDYRGKAVLLNFWATWCEPCKIEMPWFVQLQKQYGDEGLQIIGVSMDDDSPEEIAKFTKGLGVDYIVLTGKDNERDAVANLYGGVSFLPENFYIDREGKIVDKIYGIKSRGEIEASIKKALGSNKVAENQLSRP